jgi:hypothetical protein
MMPLKMRRKPRAIEKVENLCRTAMAEKTVPHDGTNRITPARLDKVRQPLLHRLVPLSEVRTPFQPSPSANFGKPWALANL